jgi:uncharacterized protein involved in type VI secretion and phage assembly
MSPQSLAVTYDQRMYGVVIGLVVNVIDPQEIGRVKISLPWYASGYEEWARVAQMYAGAKYGSTWIPEDKCEVLVMFAHGDMRFPYVIGCLHSKVDPPPEPRTKDKDVKTLKTRAGSELRFDEREGIIDLKTLSGASIHLVEKPGSITLESTTKIELKAPTIKIDATKNVVIHGKERVVIKGDQQVAINSPVALD